VRSARRDARRADSRDGRCPWSETLRELAAVLGLQTWVHRVDCRSRLPDHPALVVFRRKGEAWSKDRRGIRRNREGAERRAEVDQQCRLGLRRDQRGLSRGNRVTDHDDRAVEPLECVERGARSIFVGCPSIVEREIGRDRSMAPRSQALDQRIPARTVVPVAVEQAEGAHRARVKRLGRMSRPLMRIEHNLRGWVWRP
jgi:hypothetical protein